MHMHVCVCVCVFVELSSADKKFSTVLTMTERLNNAKIMGVHIANKSFSRLLYIFLFDNDHNIIIVKLFCIHTVLQEL